jgi:putative Mg2+ transporter-C (MgtC) family protein
MDWNTSYLIKILVALIAGGLLGVEREYTGKAAGLRTFIMVSLGACIFAIISQSVFELGGFSGDPGRIAAQVVTGIGFIGAGLIIFQEHKIKGLTTAAGLLVVASLGMAAGYGLYILSILGAVAALVVLTGMRRVERFLDKRAELARQKRIREGKEE